VDDKRLFLSCAKSFAVVNHEYPGRPPVQEVPVQGIKSFVPGRARPLEKEALASFVEVLCGGIDGPRRGITARWIGAAEQQPAGTADARRQGGIGGGIAGDGRLAVSMGGVVLIVRAPGGRHEDHQQRERAPPRAPLPHPPSHPCSAPLPLFSPPLCVKKSASATNRMPTPR